MPRLSDIYLEEVDLGSMSEVVVGLALGLLGSLWVSQDAKKRGVPHAGLWAVFTFLALIIGLPLYLFYRGKYTGQTVGPVGTGPEAPKVPDAGTQALPPSPLLDHYRQKYPHNPEGVLNFHIQQLMKEGRTREESERELMTKFKTAQAR